MGKTKKVGITGKYGTRYGSVNRKRTKIILDRMKSKNNKCPKCETKGSIHRISTGIWYCRKCDAKFTGGAYSILTERGAESFRIAKRKQREIELIEEE
ncbi:MAG: 50S ribosomal protein L37ae [Candidatus Lokiarchaeota archaeon]|nr:50S ribosomal protein L37ae [Candidatus Lokiarchaeota archaeon]MBD3199333.1 50S ribosomal protein L37ae [Candidatus Lokiarchaeota archaeon]